MPDFKDLQTFWIEDGREVPAVTTEQMREADRIAAEDFGLGILQMMENAGRNLASLVMDHLGSSSGKVVILAGSGGNGGGGLCCGRHLSNRGISVDFVLDRPAGELQGAAAAQWSILSAEGAMAVEEDETIEVLEAADIIVDVLIGYSLQGAPRGRVADLILACNRLEKAVIALDVPSDLDATLGENSGAMMRTGTTLTLALPKTGLKQWPGDLFLGDIGIPRGVYQAMGVTFEPFFRDKYIIRIHRESPDHSFD
jgi:NAD(P)H-hydrate epimerase